ncbi:DUF4873 domain-containing protein [Streptomyces sp. NPDC044780]|uniref:DUF4873 domain-containing protein n=1 Tax=Streptomyces luomodiensis TaxID=3026192 RepID=A0ABY9V8D7_9ACTN|nr:DUF4873 domain-containing protein [Streptomyces sp. SCA4-21]WNF00872.1 DUF4873 domain-containing protein [Streptomyces sp. SCA4-21]
MNDDEVYDGPAALTVAGVAQEVRVRLAGRIDPIDGKYHWQGTVVAASSPEKLSGGLAVSVTIGSRTAEGRLAEQTPWGSYSITGVGAPPFDQAEFD